MAPKAAAPAKPVVAVAKKPEAANPVAQNLLFKVCRMTLKG